MSDTYLFMSQPRAVETRRKYRVPQELEEELGNTANLMFDPRVYRGVTCGRPVPMRAMGHATSVGGGAGIKRPSKRHLERLGLIRPQQQSVADIHETLQVQRERVEVPLHLYLIEQEETVQTVHQAQQTDDFLPEPPEPAYIPRKIGVDTGSQVDTDEVFDYDRDVVPILEVVISKTIEQGLMEVRQEQELKLIARRKGFLQDKAVARQVEAQNLENLEGERLKRKEQTMVAARLRVSQEDKLHQKLAANVFAARWLEGIQEKCMDELDAGNFFASPVALAVREFMPWLEEAVHKKSGEMNAARDCVDGLINGAIETGRQQQLQLLQEKEKERERLEEEARKQAEAEAEAAKRMRVVSLYIHTEVVPNSPVGPISIRGDSTVAQVEEKISEWLRENSDEPPDLARLKFLWNGQTLDKTNILYDVGVENLSTITMVLADEPDLAAEESNS